MASLSPNGSRYEKRFEMKRKEKVKKKNDYTWRSNFERTQVIKIIMIKMIIIITEIMILYNNDNDDTAHNCDHCFA